jgi:orotate phosphoribosyltransferase
MTSIVDPLRLKIETLLREGEASPLNKARLRYGTQDDLKSLFKTCKSVPAGDRGYFLVDFTPFERIGRPAETLKSLALLRHPRPVVMVMGDALLAEFRAESGTLPLLVARFSEDGSFRGLEGADSTPRTIRQLVTQDLVTARQSSPPGLHRIREEFADTQLINLLYDQQCVVHPRESNKNCLLKYGRPHMQMPNGMLVSCYFNLKGLGRHPSALVKIAYESLLVLSDNFRRDRDALADFDTIVVPNNTALFLASTLQQMLEKKRLVAIDRLGPIPASHLQTDPIVKELKGRNVVLIEEVVATGNEVDRCLLILGSAQAKVSRIIAFYNLQVGSPMLTKPNQLVSICRPKDELSYVYRSG